MLSTQLSKGFDEFLFGIPLIVLLVVGFFRLDEVFTAPKEPRKERTRRTFDPAQPERHSPMSDPDGRPWQPRTKRRE